MAVMNGLGLSLGSLLVQSQQVLGKSYFLANTIGDQFELGYVLYPTTSGGSNWAISENPVISPYFWGTNSDIPTGSEIDRSSTNTSTIIASSLDGNAAQIASSYNNGGYTGYVLPSLEAAQKIEIGLVPALGAGFFIPYDGESFWTSTQDPTDSSKAYYFTIKDGAPWDFLTAAKTNTFNLWPVIRYNN